ncbi:hypothetical protein Nepgr_001846 [Nepenthes gracilis]|uniref:Major facilitator superfamily (MFS) profile domain-containing protein n=1 Tax=Nepenthes gracilis TaxID=150966 RepID=A0AAD3P976_NEPGR|nr:hypothetical protein Nepgr_001846 [Nepenthes gracilis]
MGITSLTVDCGCGCSLHPNKRNLISIANRYLESLTIPEEPRKLVLVGKNTQKLSPWWEQLPTRWVIVLLCFTSFLWCHLDRANRSIARLPKSQEFNGKSAIVGLIQFFPFWDHLLTQIGGSSGADKIGGKLVLGFGVIGWSVAIVLTPIAAKINLSCLLIMRVVMGMGEGVAMPAMNIISKWIPVYERSRTLALIYSSMYLGSVTELVFLPSVLHQIGWPSDFGSFESLGGAWVVLWLGKAYCFPNEELGLSGHKNFFILGGSISREPVILSRAPVWALKFAHFCHNWGTFPLLIWVPTYYHQVLKFHLMESRFSHLFSVVTQTLFANIGGWMADTVVTRGLAATSVRKIMQSIEVLGPIFLLGPRYSRVESKAFGQQEADSEGSWEPHVYANLLETNRHRHMDLASSILLKIKRKIESDTGLHRLLVDQSPPLLFLLVRRGSFCSRGRWKVIISGYKSLVFLSL